MTVLLFYGDNALEMGEATHAARAPFNPADVLTFEGASVPLPTLSEACLTAGLFDPQRLVIVNELHDRFKGSRKDSPEMEEVRRIISHVAPTTTLLLTDHDMPPDHPLLGVLKAAGGEPRAFLTPRKQDLARWIIERARNQGIAMGRDAAELLAELIGTNPVMLQNEIEKLATYADGRQITPAMVDTLVGQVTQESIFALVDAVAAGDKARAFHLLREQLDEASSTPTDVALYVIRMLGRQVRILLRVRLGQGAGKSNGQIISDLKLPRYFADRYFKQARRLSEERLRASFERLASLELALKTGRIEAAVGLDLLVAELSA